jgi:hypothetical protein
VKRFSDVARAETHLELAHIKKLFHKWEEHGGELSQSKFYEVFGETLGKTVSKQRV